MVLLGGCMGEIPLVGAPNSVPGGLDCVCVYIHIVTLHTQTI